MSSCKFYWEGPGGSEWAEQFDVVGRELRRDQRAGNIAYHDRCAEGGGALPARGPPLA